MLGLQRLNIGSRTPGQAREILSGLGGVFLAELNPEKGEAQILIDCSITTPEKIMEEILGAGMIFGRYYFADQSTD